MDRKLKHLDFVQGVINRLSTNSFLLKGWNVVLVSALFALAATDSEVSFVFLAYLPAVVFWGLDGYFLALERNYRKLYDRIRVKDPDEIDFSMSTEDLQNGISGWVSATLSKTLVPFHGSVVGAVTLVMVLQL